MPLLHSQAMLMRRLPWNEDQRIMLENAEPEDVITAARVRNESACNQQS